MHVQRQQSNYLTNYLNIQGGICRGEAGELPLHPSLDLTFPPTGLSENLGGMEGRGGKGEREEWGRPPALLPPTGFCLKYHPVNIPYVSSPMGKSVPTYDVYTRFDMR